MRCVILWQLAAITLCGCATSPMTNNDAPGPESRSIGRLFQVIINVRDMDKQIAFYRDVMGFTIVYPLEVDDYSREDFVRFDTGGANLVLHKGRRNSNAGDEPRLSFMTDNIEAVRSRLVKAGIWIDVIRSPAPGVLVADARDPEGNAFHIEAHGSM
ncbi:MAG: VOC family protein [Phycisphaerales bacterium]